MAITLEKGNPGTELLRQFWSQLTANSNTIALSQLWLVEINTDSIRKLMQYINTNFNDYEPDWNYQAANIIALQNRWFVGNKYYLLANSAVFPGDGIDVERTGVNMSGGIKGIIANGRSELPTVRIGFIETNQSFVDMFIRPWSIMVGHMGLKFDEVKLPEINLYAFQKWQNGEALVVRKVVKLIDIVPIRIDAEEYNYTGDKLINREIEFAYRKYIIDGVNDLENYNVGDIVQKDGESNIGSETPNVKIDQDDEVSTGFTKIVKIDEDEGVSTSFTTTNKVDVDEATYQSFSDQVLVDQLTMSNSSSIPVKIDVDQPSISRMIQAVILDKISDLMHFQNPFSNKDIFPSGATENSAAGSAEVDIDGSKHSEGPFNKVIVDAILMPPSQSSAPAIIDSILL